MASRAKALLNKENDCRERKNSVVNYFEENTAFLAFVLFLSLLCNFCILQTFKV